jgi:hypothetical protein
MRVFTCSAIIFLIVAAFAMFAQVVELAPAAAPSVFRALPQFPGYGLKPGAASAWTFSGRVVQTSVDNNGHRVTRGQVTEAIRIVHLVGDSQVFGWGLSDSETIASYLQHNLGNRFLVINDGVPGFGPVEFESIVSDLPRSDVVVILFSEENDLWDTFGIFRNSNIKCGFIMSSTLSQIFPCVVLRSAIVQRALRWYDSNFYYRTRPTPIGLTQISEVAAIVLSHRVNELFQTERSRRPGRIFFGKIPWVGNFSDLERKKYFPPVASILRSELLPDEIGIERGLITTGLREKLFLPGDSHLSPAGAANVAEIIKAVLSKTD